MTSEGFRMTGKTIFGNGVGIGGWGSNAFETSDDLAPLQVPLHVLDVGYSPP